MGLLKLVCDVSNKRLVKSLTDSSAFILPKFVYGDRISLELLLVEPDNTGGIQRPFSVVDTAPYSLKIAIGDAPNTTPDALQDTFSKYTGEEARFTGYLDLGATAMGTAIGTARAISRFLEIELNSVDAGYETLVQQEVTIWNQVISGASAAPLPTDEYFTKAEQGQLFPGFIMARGQTLTMPSPNGIYARQLGCNDDGTALDNIITL